MFKKIVNKANQSYEKNEGFHPFFSYEKTFVDVSRDVSFYSFDLYFDLIA